MSETKRQPGSIGPALTRGEEAPPDRVGRVTSSTLKWPDARKVDEAVRALAQKLAHTHPELRRVGYFGSYARGDWGSAVTSISSPSSTARTDHLQNAPWISISAACPCPPTCSSIRRKNGRRCCNAAPPSSAAWPRRRFGYGIVLVEWLDPVALTCCAAGWMRAS